MLASPHLIVCKVVVCGWMAGCWRVQDVDGFGLVQSVGQVGTAWRRSPKARSALGFPLVMTYKKCACGVGVARKWLSIFTVCVFCYGK